MTFTSLNERINDLPLILCGPILRRTEHDSVTVWVALRKARDVTLRIYSRAKPEDTAHLSLEMEGTGRTVKLGEHLHVVAVTAEANTGSNSLKPGEIYFYDLVFPECYSGSIPKDANCLKIPGILDSQGSNTITRLYYSQNPYEQYPSFSLPPNDINQLRIIHGSCRKPHNEGMDALETLDQILTTDWPVADERPHLMMHTGDQIYADDVSASLLEVLIDAGKTLLGWEEKLPSVKNDDDLKPRNRENLVIKIAKFTSEDTENHLLSLGEFYSMYLFTWSDVLWPTSFSPLNKLSTKDIPNTIKDRKRLAQFQKTLPQVRRALANVPSYMILDDHEITDDLYLTWDWCECVLGSELGRRVIQNGLLAYTVFQAWGNTPQQFVDPSGNNLLNSAQNWSNSKGTDLGQEATIGRCLGIPQKNSLFAQDPKNKDKILNKATDSINWHYCFHGPNYEFIVLDTRTRRGYPGERFDPPSLLSKSALYEQIDCLRPNEKLITFVVTATPLVTFPFYHHWFVKYIYKPLKWLWNRKQFLILKFSVPRHKRLVYDPELADHWKGPKNEPFELVLAKLASRATVSKNNRESQIVILTGDVHFSGASRLQYSADISLTDKPEPPPAPIDAVFVQLTSSSMRKQTVDTLMLHHTGYETLLIQAMFLKFPQVSIGDAINELPSPVKWLGWREPVGIGFSTKDVGRLAQTWEDLDYLPWMLRDKPPMLKIDEQQGAIHYPVPVSNGSSSVEFAKITMGDSGKKLFIPKPDWVYRIDYILAENEVREAASEKPLEVHAPSPGDRKQALRSYLAAAKNHQNYAQKWGNGKEIIGVNNISEIFIHWKDGKKSITQNAWWRMKDRSNEEKSLIAFPLSKFQVSLDTRDPSYPLPKVPRKV